MQLSPVLLVAVAVNWLSAVAQPVFAGNQTAPVSIAQSAPVLETSYHGNILLRVNGVTIQRDTVAVNLEVTNNSPISITLNSGLPGRGMILQDDLGNQYSINPPEDNPAVAVGSGDRLSGTFTFSGPLAANARSLTLITNVGSGQTEISPTIVPKMTISGIALQ